MENKINLPISFTELTKVEYISYYKDAECSFYNTIYYNLFDFYKPIALL
jgi:hypothetical protein